MRADPQQSFGDSNDFMPGYAPVFMNSFEASQFYLEQANAGCRVSRFRLKASDHWLYCCQPCDNRNRVARMSPWHRWFVRQLHTTTALLCSASWLASENIRLMRVKNNEHYIATKWVTLQQEIEGAILLSEVRPIMERMN